MDLLQAVVLGVIQGLTEFLPISSSAHLRIVPAILGWDDPGAAFTAVTQLGTVAAVLIFFRRDLWRIGVAWLRSFTDATVRRTHDARMGWYILAGTIPVAVFGVLFEDQIQTQARDLRLIGFMLIALGLLLLLAEKVGSRTRRIEDMRARDVAVIGTAQAVALIPGSSRSGCTITAGMFLGFTRYAAARFSFLLSVPAIVASGLFQLGDIGGENAYSPLDTAVATVVAFAVGYASIAWLLRWLTSHSTMVFVVYRVALGLLVLGLVAGGVVEANEPASGAYIESLG